VIYADVNLFSENTHCNEKHRSLSNWFNEAGCKITVFKSDVAEESGCLGSYAMSF